MTGCWVSKPGAFEKTCAVPLRCMPKPASAIGDDRLASALGALSLGPALPWVVVDCGTAMTVNAVSPLRTLPRAVAADAPPVGLPVRSRGMLGTFEGGLIVPGEALMLHSLHAGTAQVPQFMPWPFQKPRARHRTLDAGSGFRRRAPRAD